MNNLPPLGKATAAFDVGEDGEVDEEAGNDQCDEREARMPAPVMLCGQCVDNVSNTFSYWHKISGGNSKMSVLKPKKFDGSQNPLFSLETSKKWNSGSSFTFRDNGSKKRFILRYGHPCFTGMEFSCNWIWNLMKGGEPWPVLHLLPPPLLLLLGGSLLPGNHIKILNWLCWNHLPNSSRHFRFWFHDTSLPLQIYMIEPCNYSLSPEPEKKSDWREEEREENQEERWRKLQRYLLKNKESEDTRGPRGEV